MFSPRAPSLSIPVRAKNPRNVLDAFFTSRIDIFGHPRRLQRDGGGERGNEVLTDPSSGRRIKLQFQGVGARNSFPECRNGLKRGIRNRPVSRGRLWGMQNLPEVLWCLGDLISGGGYSAYQLAFGSKPAGPSRWGERGDDMSCARDTLLSRQFAQQ